jgi:2-oxoglutarate dehydrogenase E1 component
MRARLVEQGVIDGNWKGETEDRFVATLETEFEAAKSYKANHADWFGRRWSGLNQRPIPETARRNVATGIDQKRFDARARPDADDRYCRKTFTIHKTLSRVIEAKRQMFAEGAGFDWATGEALAFGSLLTRRLQRAAFRAGFWAAARSASAMRCGSTRRTSAKSGARPPCPTAKSKCMTAR